MTPTITVHTDRGAQCLPAGSTLAQLLDTESPWPGDGDHHAAFATAVNGEFVPRSEREHRVLQDDDTVLCFTAITGG